MPYLIDGNNLAHALRLAKEGLVDRAGCARAVGSFCLNAGARATLVFDGADRPEGERVGASDRMRVVFAGKQAADDVILRLVAGSKAASDLIVVTSDKPLGDRARHLGSAVERADQFARRMARAVKTGAPEGDKPDRAESAEEIDAWLEAFEGRAR
jgi:predicted RNA-binding protein with PIN domain